MGSTTKIIGTASKISNSVLFVSNDVICVTLELFKDSSRVTHITSLLTNKTESEIIDAIPMLLVVLLVHIPSFMTKLGTPLLL